MSNGKNQHFVSIRFWGTRHLYHNKMFLIPPKTLTEKCAEHWGFCFPGIRDKGKKIKRKRQGLFLGRKKERLSSLHSDLVFWKALLLQRARCITPEKLYKDAGIRAAPFSFLFSLSYHNIVLSLDSTKWKTHFLSDYDTENTLGWNLKPK